MTTSASGSAPSRQPAAPGLPAEVVIGLDVGTTAVKVVAFGVGHPWRHTAIREYPLLAPAPGWQVQDPATIVAALGEALADCVAAAHGSEVVALSVSSAMHGLIGLDADLNPLTPLVTWADSRAHVEAAHLRATGQASALHRTSGTPVHSMSPLTKLMWFARHEPEVCAAARWWVGLKDYVLLALTGSLVTELSSASSSGLLDNATRTWSVAALDVAGVRAEQLPPILSTTATLDLSTTMAVRVGLRAGTPVVVGAGDGPLGNLGTGALEPGVVGLSLGTSGAVRMVVPRPVVDPDGRLFCYALTDDAWVVGGAVSNGGVVVRWAGDVFGSDLRPGPDGAPRDAELLALAHAVPPGSDGLVMLPYLLAERAPLWDPDLTGAYLGIRHAHTRGHFVRAAVEGVAFQLSAIVDELDRLEPVTQIRATGGVFRSPVWREVMAAVLARPLRVTGGAEGSALGAAALGLYALGRATSLADGVALAAGGAGASIDAEPPVPVTASDMALYARARSSIPELLAAYGEVSKLFSAIAVRSADASSRR
jgi:gluconokinase